MSFLCGEIDAWGPAGPEKRQLISISELQRFNKQKGEVLILHGREYPFITYMADIDQYPDFANYRVVPIPPIEIPHVPTFDVIKFTTKNAFLPDGVPFNEPD